MLQLGCHLSVSKGFLKCVETAQQFEAASIQYFSKNPRGFRSKALDLKDAEAGAKLAADLGIRTIAHTPYLINLSSAEANLRQLSINSLLEDLRIAEARGSLGVVLHCGKHVGLGQEEGIRLMKEALVEVLEKDQTNITILLENTAGQGSEIGMTPEVLLDLASVGPKEKIGFCFDTCHAFASGIMTKEDPLLFFKNEEYTSRLYAVHLNDSKGDYGCKKDRHEKIGQGFLGAEAIKVILQAPSLQNIPVVLETPVEHEREYIEEMRLCHSLLA